MAAGCPYIYFLSTGAAAYRDLSNFKAAPIAIDLATMPTYASLIGVPPHLLPTPLVFPSTEHAWQALKATDLATFQLFMEGGRFASLTVDTIAELIKEKSWDNAKVAAKAKAKVAFYSRNDLVMVGVVAKYAANAKRAKRLGYALREDVEILPPDVEAAVWHELLMAKFQQNPGPRQVLIGTGTKLLVEFVKSARRVPSHWGGLVEADGSVTGENKMGVFLERVRRTLLTPMAIMATPLKRTREEEDETKPLAKRARHNDGVACVPYELPRGEADLCFRTLVDETPWTMEIIARWNKEIVTPHRPGVM
jgi:predicted NAD-dependent protein-ADP-ribosyltransferase YbiA (DUF1768 family)